VCEQYTVSSDYIRSREFLGHPVSLLKAKARVRDLIIIIIIIIIFINCSWTVTRWQWVSHVTKQYIY
jgi:hypothetical protein